MVTIKVATHTKSKYQHRINEEITSSEVRLIDEHGDQRGVVSRSDALNAAQDASLDLVEISPQAEPPVCRIMDYGKHLYQEKKKKAQAKKNQHMVQLKEIKIRPGTEEADYRVKLNKAIRFLEAGDKVKITLRFRGREMSHQELGAELMERMKAELEEHGVIESSPKMEGRQMVMVFGPKKK